MARNVRAAFTIAGKDLRQRVRDRSVIILGVIAPFVLALIFNLIMGDLDADSFDLNYGLVNDDGGEIAAEFVQGLEAVEAEGILTLTRGTRSDIEAKIESGELAAGFLIPAGFTPAVLDGASAEIDVVGSVDFPTSTQIAASIADGFATNIHTIQLSVATAAATAQVSDFARLAEDAAIVVDPIVLGEVEAATRQLDLTTFFIVGMSIFFLFFTVAFGVTSLLEERSEGTMARLVAAPVSRWAILSGKAIVSAALGIVSMAVLIGASTFLMGAEWGDPLGVAILVIAAVFSAIGLMAIVAAFARTAEQAGNLQSIIAVGLGMLGGIFFPTTLGEGLLARLAYISPHRWFVTGLSDLAGGSVGDVLIPAAALLAVGIAGMLIAAPRLKRALSI